MTFWHLAISLPLLPIYLIFLICVIVYKKIAFFILHVKYGSDLSDVDSGDSFFTMGKFEDNVSYILTIMNTNMEEEELRRKMVEAVNGTIIKNHHHFKKILSSLHSFMGYPFLIREDIEATDFVNIVDVEKNHYESINHLAYDYSVKPLPKQNKLLLESIILKCSEKWKAKNDLGIDQIPVLTRVHHVLGDGLSVMNLIVQLFGDNKSVIDEVIKDFNAKHKRSKMYLSLLENIYLFLIFPGFVVLNGIKMWNNNRLSLTTVGCGKQYFAKKVGDKSLIGKIKEFKQNMGDCSFIEILFSVISASLNDYFKKKNGNIPITIGTFVPAIRDLKNINQDGLPILTNQFGFAVFEIPIDFKSESMLKRISAIKEYTRANDTSINFMVLRFMLHNLLGLFPKCIKKSLFKSKYKSISLSNLPGTQKFTCFNGIEVEEMYFFIVNIEETGIGFSIITYDNRIHLGLKAFENIITSQEDCQLIVDNVFTHLNELINESPYKNI